jgi:spectinomycin phosphotransferase
MLDIIRVRKNPRMLEKPEISETRLVSRLREEYELNVAELTFLPLGADPGTAVYRLDSGGGTAYFLKLRRDFREASVRIPLFLASNGVREVIRPVETVSRRGWADLGEYSMILYPFIEGKSGFDLELTDRHRRALGAALKAIHSMKLPADLERLIPGETFSGRGRDRLKSFQARAEHEAFEDPIAAKLAGFMKSRRREIDRLVERAEQLASELRSKPLERVLCHSDVHGGNILIDGSGGLSIVDWDDPILAPKERDLMFVGGGIDEIWKSDRDEAVFYEGYGTTVVDRCALAYFRHERIVEDLAVICRQLWTDGEGGADRERSLGWFTSNFEAGNTLEIAGKTGAMPGIT